MRDDFQPYQSDAPQPGTLVQWDDEKGFGWIESGRKRFFGKRPKFILSVSVALGGRSAAG